MGSNPNGNMDIFIMIMGFDGSKTTRAWAQKPAQKLGLRGDKEADPIKGIKEFDPLHMPKHEGPGFGSPRLRS